MALVVISPTALGTVHGEFHVPFLAPPSNVSTTSAVFALLPGCLVNWIPLNWSSNVTWYLETIVADIAVCGVHVFNYNAGALGATDYGGYDGTPGANVTILRSGPLTLPGTNTTLCVAAKTASGTAVVYGARFVGVL